jgi:hypothetical protein
VSEEATLLYLETDDEVTSVARRVREADAARVVLVAPGRSRATSSVVALRLLARIGEEADRRLAVVGDALTRSLAVEAGLDAYATVDDARRAVPAPTEQQARQASIHVVRGDVSDDTAPVALGPAGTPAPSGAVDSDTETRAVPIIARRELPRDRAAEWSRPWWRAVPPAVLLGALLAVLFGAGVLGAMILPAASITVTPVAERLGPVPYEVRIDEPERLQGTVDATAPVTATGTYPIQAAATGTVVFFNFNVFDVAVGAGTLVAAGDQAFETLADIVVPAGSLTPDGRIQAGDAAVGVAAAAVGPAANVPAEAIDTILDQNVAARLRGFGNNPERLVVNPAATAGGVDETGPEIVQEDVDAAQSALLEQLNAEVADALSATGDAVFADPSEQPQPLVEGVEGLVETRDQESAEIGGRLAYDRLVVDRDDVNTLAAERFLADATVLPAGHEQLPSEIEVTIGEVRREGDAMVVAVSVTGASTPAIDRDEVVERVRDRSVDDARAALLDLGDATIALWPDWVTTVPGIDWRIDVTIAGGNGSIEPAPSAP